MAARKGLLLLALLEFSGCHTLLELDGNYMTTQEGTGGNNNGSSSSSVVGSNGGNCHHLPNTPTTCGNGIINIGEECDDDNCIATDSCNNNCKSAYCGDGVVQPPESCDNSQNCSPYCDGPATASSGAGGTGGSGMMTMLETYCANIMASCTGANAQYTSAASCMAAAATFMEGTYGATTGNTLGCRTYHTLAISVGANDPAFHCPHAGPSGGGACGSICDGFCDIAFNVCGTEWPDKYACISACANIPSTMQSYNTSFTTAGDSIECRLVQVTVAATDASSAVVHCPETVVPSSQCKP